MENKRPQKVQAQKLIGQVFNKRKYIISDKQSIFYALSIGFSQDPLKQQDHKYTSDVSQNFSAFPLLATMSHQTDFLTYFTNSPYMPIFDTNVIRYAEHTFTMLKDEFDLSLEYQSQTKIVDVVDKGKHMLVWFQIRVIGGGEVVGVNRCCLIFQGMGGFGYQSKNLYPVPAKIPTRKPDTILEAKTYPNQAFFFRLTGDRNPLHINTKSAKKLDFKQPIIHGMATYGTIGRVFSQQILGNDHTRIRSYKARFTSFVYPGEILTLRVWKDGENFYVFQAETVGRKTKVLVGSIQLRPVAKL